MHQRVIEICGTLNFRDLGGYQADDGRTVQWGRLYRSAQLDRLSSNGVAQLSALRIKTVVDLRFSNESEKYPTLREAVPEAEMLSWHQEQASDSADRSKAMQSSWYQSLESHDPDQVHEAMRSNYPQKLYSHAAIFREMLLRLASARTPLLFHCAAGKDRTGVAAALILALLGVSKRQIVDDYLLTQQQLEGRIDEWIAGGATSANNNADFQRNLSRYPKHVLRPIFAAEEAYIQTLLAYVEATYGSFENYTLQKLDLDPTTIEQLREHLLS